MSYPGARIGDGSKEIVTVAQLDVRREQTRLEPFLTISASLCA